MKEKSLGNTRALVNAALLAAVYAAITYMTKPISFSQYLTELLISVPPPS